MGKVRANGFTLMELMIVVVVMAILISLAYPAYDKFVRKARRGDAQSALTGLANTMQRYYTEQSASTFVGAAVGASGIYPDKVPLDGTVKYYTLSISAQTVSAYTVNAAPINAQAGDKCGTLTLNSTGVEGITGQDAGVTVADCWR